MPNKLPQFLKVHCVNTDNRACAICSRDYLIPLSCVLSFSKHGDRAFITFMPNMFCFDTTNPSSTRFMETEMLWTDLLAILDGDVADLGNISLSDLQKV